MLNAADVPPLVVTVTGFVPVVLISGVVQVIVVLSTTCTPVAAVPSTDTVDPSSKSVPKIVRLCVEPGFTVLGEMLLMVAVTPSVAVLAWTMIMAQGWVLEK